MPHKSYILQRVLIVLICAGCKKDPSLWKIQNLNNNKISVFGHGGMGIDYRYPMNSYESLSHCLKLGADGTEMDVCVTKDTVMVLYHDQTLEEETSCNGSIKEKIWEEIKSCRYNNPIIGRADLIPASYFFDRVENKDKLTFTFDCKVIMEDDIEYLNIFAEALYRHIIKYDLVSHCFIESFNITFLEILQKKDKNLHLFLYTQDYQTGLEVSKEIKLYGLTLDFEKISAEEIKQAHENNLRITLFNTQTEHQNLDAITKSPDFIQTDKVDYLINALN
jgi:glycerophosphoryl diester phosphodiesterase